MRRAVAYMAIRIKAPGHQSFAIPSGTFWLWSSLLSQDKEHPRYLIPELCKQFYHLGWVTGTGGGISLKHGDEIYIAPSGVQKERIQPEDMFVCDINEKDISGPLPSKKLKKSQCTPLFMNAYTMRGAGAVIHTHSKAAVMATLLFPGREFKITHQEMIKGIKKCTSGGYYRYGARDVQHCYYLFIIVQ
ncbi:PREDICTED: methylthioribulose-1-phosphate dehydratase [Colobus angolensis palliatus]|uniref:methylthioribulose-1-phosphate dehydratase n=1 Tax=Colobus angolensis palliatus TaxID=336983 RepID=UPI0005F536DC|nr:PREDICTED: methylthioribulose-1-phosphate dehydratase [Colobus angolensis palliatus]